MAKLFKKHPIWSYIDENVLCPTCKCAVALGSGRIPKICPYCRQHLSDKVRIDVLKETSYSHERYCPCAFEKCVSGVNICTRNEVYEKVCEDSKPSTCRFYIAIDEVKHV